MKQKFRTQKLIKLIIIKFKIILKINLISSYIYIYIYIL